VGGGAKAATSGGNAFRPTLLSINATLRRTGGGGGANTECAQLVDLNPLRHGPLSTAPPPQRPTAPSRAGNKGKLKKDLLVRPFRRSGAGAPLNGPTIVNNENKRIAARPAFRRSFGALRRSDSPTRELVSRAKFNFTPNHNSHLYLISNKSQRYNFFKSIKPTGPTERSHSAENNVP